jgi:hypothetical protein
MGTAQLGLCVMSQVQFLLRARRAEVLAREHRVIVSYDRTIYSRQQLRFSFQCAHPAVALETKRDLPNDTRTLHGEYCFSVS